MRASAKHVFVISLCMCVASCCAVVSAQTLTSARIACTVRDIQRAAVHPYGLGVNSCAADPRRKVKGGHPHEYATRHDFRVIPVLFGSAQVAVIRAGRLIDPDSAAVLTDQEILIVGNRVSAVGKQLHVSKDAKWIDLTDKTVLPGLIDCHTHIVDGLTAVNGDPFNVVKETAAQMVLGAVPNAEKALFSGFTSVRDVGVYRALTDVALRDAISRGDIVGPRMYVAGAYVTITGGAGAMTGQAPDVQLPWDLHYGEANGPWEMRQKIRLLAHDGVDHIKVLSSGGVLTHGSNPKA